MLVVAIMVAILGIVNTLTALILERKRELARLEGTKSNGWVDRLLENLFRCLRGHLFDIHTTSGRSHKHRTPAGAIQNDAQIELFVDRQSFLDQKYAHVRPPPPPQG